MIIFRSFRNGDDEVGLYFCSCSFAFYFVRNRVKNFILVICTFVDVFIGLNPLHLKEKYRKWTSVFRVRFWMFFHKTKQNFVINPNDDLKNRCHSKTILVSIIVRINLFYLNFLCSYIILLVDSGYYLI